MNNIINELDSCHLCPHKCGANRNASQVGLCNCSATLKVARASLHMWEEPCISGKNGSGTVFFSGCTLRCSFCQNSDISAQRFGKDISIEQLSQIFINLQSKGAHNINLVTPTQYTYHIIRSIKLSRANGLAIPIVYNTSGFETQETIAMLDGYVDVFLTDFKYISEELSGKYSGAPTYSKFAKLALDQMVLQVGECSFDSDGMIQNGVVVRHLVLPTLQDDSKAVVKYIYNRFKDTVYLSLMNQYTPMKSNPFQELDRKITTTEYDELVNYAIVLGVENGFIQEGETASESFIPSFDLYGVD